MTLNIPSEKARLLALADAAAREFPMFISTANVNRALNDFAALVRAMDKQIDDHEASRRFWMMECKASRDRNTPRPHRRT